MKTGFFKQVFIREFFMFSYLSITSFIAWNYYGILFFVFGYELFKHLKNSISLRFEIYLLKTFILLASWELGALFWLLEVDKGFFVIVSHLIFTLFFFLFFFLILKKAKSKGLIIFIPLWLLFEYFQNTVNISFPWLTIGNVFSSQVYIIQWYEYTGVLGGSLWFLVTSYYLFKAINYKNAKYYYMLFVWFLIPVLASILMLKNEKIEETSTEKVLVFNNEFLKKKNNLDISYYLYDTIKSIKGVRTLITPEYSFRNLNIDKFEKSFVFKYFRKIIAETNIEKIYFGTLLYKKNDGIANGSVFMTEKKTFFKVKKKLVPYTESMPKIFYIFFNKMFFNDKMIDSEAGLISEERILPLICYEVFFSLYVSKKVSDCKIIYLISSEKFLNNSFYGQKQYNNIIKLRCIENRLPMLKISGYGTSSYIDSYGFVKKESRKEFDVFDVSLNK